MVLQKLIMEESVVWCQQPLQGMELQEKEVQKD